MKYILILSCFLSSFGLAGTLETILEGTERPTMAMIDELAAEHPTNPLADRVSVPGHVSSWRLTERLALAIAAWERTFPGATFYPVGRDAVFIGDAIDAFYRSVGQNDRVRRLDASAPSFRHDDDRITNAFLRTSGVDVTRALSEPPHIFFDTTSFNPTNGIGGGASQSVRLIRAAYRAFAEAGGDPRSLVEKINFISVGGIHGVSEMFSSGWTVAGALQAQRETATAAGFARPLYFDLGNMTYTIAWHDMFEKFVPQADGRVTAPHGRVASLSTRQSIVTEMWETRRIMASPEFRAAVERHALLLGYVFPQERSTTLRAASPAEVAEARAAIERERQLAEQRRLAEYRQSMRTKREKRDRANGVSPAGSNYLDRLEERLSAAPDRAEARLQALSFLFEDLPTATQLTDADLVAILRGMLASVGGWENDKLVAALVELAGKAPRVAAALRTGDIKADPYGEMEYRVERNVHAVRTALGGSAPEPEPPGLPSAGSCADWIVWEE